MFSDPCSTRIPLDTCRCTSSHCWHKCAGSHVPGHMNPNLNLKRKAHTSVVVRHQKQSLGFLQSLRSQFPLKEEDASAMWQTHFTILTLSLCISSLFTPTSKIFTIVDMWCVHKTKCLTSSYSPAGAFSTLINHVLKIQMRYFVEHEMLDYTTDTKYAYWNKSGAYVSKFSGPHSIHIPHDNCRYTSHHCWHKCAGNHVHGHMDQNLKRNTSTSDGLNLHQSKSP